MKQPRIWLHNSCYWCMKWQLCNYQTILYCRHMCCDELDTGILFFGFRNISFTYFVIQDHLKWSTYNIMFNPPVATEWPLQSQQTLWCFCIPLLFLQSYLAGCILPSELIQYSNHHVIQEYYNIQDQAWVKPPSMEICTNFLSSKFWILSSHFFSRSSAQVWQRNAGLSYLLATSLA